MPHGKWPDHSTVDPSHPDLPAHGRSTDSAREQGSEGPGQHTAALGPPAGSPHPPGAVDYADQSSPVTSVTSTFTAAVGIIRDSA